MEDATPILKKHKVSDLSSQGRPFPLATLCSEYHEITYHHIIDWILQTDFTPESEYSNERMIEWWSAFRRTCKAAYLLHHIYIDRIKRRCVELQRKIDIWWKMERAHHYDPHYWNYVQFKVLRDGSVSYVTSAGTWNDKHGYLLDESLNE